MPKKHLTKKDLETLKKIILKRKEEFVRELDDLRQNSMASTIKEASGDHSSYAFHMADQGTDASEREKAFMFASREGRYVEQLDDALQRIEDGTFGICVVCQKPIGMERLKAVPTATQCIDCKTAGSRS